MKDNPCKTCIILGMCRHKGTHTGGVMALARKCSLLNEYIHEGNGCSELNIEFFYEAYSYFERGWKENI